MFNRKEFELQKAENAKNQFSNKELQSTALKFIIESDKLNYAYQWTWLGLPIIQMPEDIVAIQEIIWENKPDVIIETGIAWGGSVVLYASILELIGKGKVIAIDKVLPQHNIDKLKAYPFSNRIHLFEGSSTDELIYDNASSLINDGDKVMVILDSNHTHEHVYNELKLWGPLVTKGQYLVVSDTIIEEIPGQTHRVRPWGPGANPKTALKQYLAETNRFDSSNPYNEKALASYTRGGYVKCKS